MGDVKKWVNAGGLWDPAGSIARVQQSQSSHPIIRGTIGNMETQQINKPITLHNTLDPGGNVREQTTGVKGSANPLGPPQQAAPFNPNAPGSIFNMGQNKGPFINPQTWMAQQGQQPPQQQSPGQQLPQYQAPAWWGQIPQRQNIQPIMAAPNQTNQQLQPNNQMIGSILQKP